jgi:hypothetical protein
MVSAVCHVEYMVRERTGNSSGVVDLGENSVGREDYHTEGREIYW